MNERERKEKPFRLIGSLRVILKNSKNYSRVVKTALLSTKKKSKSIMQLCLPYLNDLGGQFYRDKLDICIG